MDSHSYSYSSSPAALPFAPGPLTSLSVTPDFDFLAVISKHSTVHFADISSFLSSLSSSSTTQPKPISSSPNDQSLTLTPSTSSSSSSSSSLSSSSSSSLTSICLPHRSCLYLTDSRGTLSRFNISSSSSNSASPSFSIPAAHSGAELTSVTARSSDAPCFTAAKDGIIRCWDPSTCQAIAKFTGHKYEVRSLDTLTHDVVISAGRDRTVRVWDTRLQTSSSSSSSSSSCIACFEGHTGWVHDVAALTNEIVSCSGDKTVRVWDLRNLQQRKVLHGHRYRIWTVDAAKNARIAVTGSTDTCVKLWHVDDHHDHDHEQNNNQGQNQNQAIESVTLDGHADSVLSVAVRHDGNVILSACEDGTLFAWTGQKGFCIEDSTFITASTSATTNSQTTTTTSTTTTLTTTQTQQTNNDNDESNVITKDTSSALIDFSTSVDNDNDNELSKHNLSSPIENKSKPSVVFDTQQLPIHHHHHQQQQQQLQKVEEEKEPVYDKSAAELVVALTRIQQLENALRDAERRAEESCRAVSALRLEISRRDDTVRKLERQLAASKRMDRALQVNQLLAANQRKADVFYNNNNENMKIVANQNNNNHAEASEDPVNKIGAVSDQLTQLAARLDAMIATN